MAAKSDSTGPPADPIIIVVKRQFDAPAERVFDVWLDRESIACWLFATPGGEMKRVEVDGRVGGEFVVFEQRGDVLAEHYGRYLEVDRPRRIVFLFAVTPFDAANSDASRVTIEIAPQGPGCEVTLTHEIDPKWAEYVERTRGGWTKILEKLDNMLSTKTASAASDREIISTRIVDAPRERVFQAFSDPVQLAQWWGPNGFTNTIDKFDFRPGGEWRLTMHGPNGVDYDNESEFVEVSAPERVVYIHLRPMHRFQMSMDFAVEGNQTRLMWRMLFDTDAECDRVREFVVPANEQNFDRLAAHLKTTA